MTPCTYLTRRDVALLLKVSVATVARWTKGGKLPSYRLSKRAIRYKREDVERFMVGGGVAGAPQPCPKDDL